VATVQSAENEAVAAYNEYLDAFENAKQQYETAVCEAWNRYYAAIAEADAQREAAIASARRGIGGREPTANLPPRGQWEA
jgi:precorrin-3B methylase